MIMLFLLLTGVLTLSSANYWGVPQLHQVNVCFDASNERGSLAIEKLVDPNTNRLYSPNSFGFDRYPISIGSGECIEGELTNLLSRLTLALIGNQVDVTVQNNPPDGRFFISINEAPAVVVFDRESDEQTPDPIVVKDGFDQGKRVGMPWGQRWFQGLKLLIVLISALFISLFLFGLTETFFTFPVENNLHSHERAGNEIKESHLSQLTGYKVLLAFTLLYFIAFGLLMVHTSGQPDQGPHAYFSRKFSETWRIPEDDPNIQYLIKGQPYLYYWINGAVYKILRFLLPSVNIVPGLLWRLISLFYATLTVFFTYQLGKKVTGNPYYGILAAFFLSNTLMFVFVRRHQL